MRRVSRTLLLAWLLVMIGLPPAAQQRPTAPNRPPEVPPEVVGKMDAFVQGPPIEPLGESRFRIGNLVLDRAAREIRFPGAIALREGTLEYLICAPRGKLYESLLRGDVDPYHLHLALLLIGLQPENNLGYQGDPTTPRGDHVTIHVSWAEGDGRATHRAEMLVGHHARDGAMRKTTWVFSGSRFVEGVFAASIEKCLVAVYNDPAAILNNPLPSGGDDTFYVPNTDWLPAVGTEVEIILTAAAPGSDTGA